MRTHIQYSTYIVLQVRRWLNSLMLRYGNRTRRIQHSPSPLYTLCWLYGSPESHDARWWRVHEFEGGPDHRRHYRYSANRVGSRSKAGGDRGPILMYTGVHTTILPLLIAVENIPLELKYRLRCHQCQQASQQQYRSASAVNRAEGTRRPTFVEDLAVGQADVLTLPEFLQVLLRT